MRHRNKINKLSRTHDQRRALIRSLLRAIVRSERIITTEAKAKALRSWVDRLIVWTQADTLHTRRLSFRLLGDHALVKKLFDSIGPRYKGFNGGATRIIDLGLRKGDCAKMSVFELTKADLKSKAKTVKKTDHKAAAAAPEKGSDVVSDKSAEPKKNFFQGVKNIFKKDKE